MRKLESVALVPLTKSYLGTCGIEDAVVLGIVRLHGDNERFAEKVATHMTGRLQRKKIHAAMTKQK